MGANFSKATKSLFSKKKKKTKKKSFAATLKDKTLVQRANEGFLSTDMFAEPIAFNFKG